MRLGLNAALVRNKSGEFRIEKVALEEPRDNGNDVRASESGDGLKAVLIPEHA